MGDLDLRPLHAELRPSDARELAEGFGTDAPMAVLLGVVAAVVSLGWAAWLFMHLPVGAAWAALVGSLVAVVAACWSLSSWERRRMRLDAARFVLFARVNGFEAHPPQPVAEAELPPGVRVCGDTYQVGYRLTGVRRGLAFHAGRVDHHEGGPVWYLAVDTPRPVPYSPDVSAAAAQAKLSLQPSPTGLLGTGNAGFLITSAEGWARQFAVLDAIADAVERQQSA